MTDPGVELAADCRLVLDARLAGKGWRVCAKLLALVDADDDRESDTPVRRLLGVVGAVR